jgi:hypothetical protein
MKAIIILFSLVCSLIYAAETETFFNTERDSFKIHYNTVEITGDKITYTNYAKDNKDSSKDKTIRSVGNIKGDKIIITEMYFNNKRRDPKQPIELKFRREKDNIYIENELYQKKI